jgi:hypothetical protein
MIYQPLADRFMKKRDIERAYEIANVSQRLQNPEVVLRKVIPNQLMQEA